MKIEDYKIGQKVSLYGIIEEINIEDIYDKENTTTLSIKTVTGKIHVNPKWEEVTIKLDQPKLIVPQFVADWYEENKDDSEEFILDLVDETIRGCFSGAFDEWSRDTENKPIQTLINMHQFGYTVEKEKLYQIIDKRLDVTFSCLGYAIEDGVWFWANKKFFLKNKGVRLAHTQQQLIDAGFEEVFENPNYEAEEVTE